MSYFECWGVFTYGFIVNPKFKSLFLIQIALLSLKFILTKSKKEGFQVLASLYKVILTIIFSIIILISTFKLKYRW